MVHNSLMYAGSGGIIVIATIVLQLSSAWFGYTPEVNIFVYM
jgi:hypothetical protein